MGGGSRRVYTALLTVHKGRLSISEVRQLKANQASQSARMFQILLVVRISRKQKVARKRPHLAFLYFHFFSLATLLHVHLQYDSMFSICLLHVSMSKSKTPRVLKASFMLAALKLTFLNDTIFVGSSTRDPKIQSSSSRTSPKFEYSSYDSKNQHQIQGLHAQTLVHHEHGEKAHSILF